MRNKQEIDNDGATGQNVRDFLTLHDVTAKNLHGKRRVSIGEITFDLPNSGTINLFSKRAILRIGMLLRDSKVAKEVRTQLLNTFEHATVAQRISTCHYSSLQGTYSGESIPSIT